MKSFADNGVIIFVLITLAWCRPTILPTEPYLDLDLDNT